MKTNKKKNLLSTGLIVGSLVGAAATFFLAPQKGIETQKWLAKKLNSVTQKSIIKTQNTLLKFEVALEENLNKDQEYL